jgi:anti-sigma factor RsiW
VTAAQARELFSDAYDRELDAAQAQAFAAALAADPALAREYAAFVATLETARASAVAAPNLLPGVQRKLRVRSRGRFYRDRFAERLGSGLVQPLPLALALCALLALAWLVQAALSWVAVSPAP